MKTAIPALLITLSLLGLAPRARADLICQTEPISKTKVTLKEPGNTRGHTFTILTEKGNAIFGATPIKYEPGFAFKKVHYKIWNASIEGTFIVATKQNIGRGGCGRGFCDQLPHFPQTATAVLNLYGNVTNFTCTVL
jgi:hypothetical protein